MSRVLPAVRSWRFPRYVGPTGSTTYVEDWGYEALLVSQGHPRRGKAWAGGGPFYCVKRRVDHNGNAYYPRWIEWGGGSDLRLEGVGPYCFSHYPSHPESEFPSWAQKVEGLQALYPKGYEKIRPGNPKASLLQFLVELRDLPRLPGRSFVPGPLGGRGFTPSPLKRYFRYSGLGPETLREKLRFFKNLGSEYLNVEFGWRPFVRDLVKLYELSQVIDKEIAKLRRENGKWLRRKATLVHELSGEPANPVVHPYNYFYVGGQPGESIFRSAKTVLSIGSTIERRVWIVGSFRYWIPNVRSVQWEDRARLALSGSLPTPKLLWDVYPFSWLADWFLDVGTVVSNLSMNAVDNLVCRYSYIMESIHEHHIAEATCSHTGGFATGWQEWPEVNGAQFSTSYLKESKARFHHGNPFGLEIPEGSFTPKQLGILAALGLSQGLPG
jgi:hypothetical protein